MCDITEVIPFQALGRNPMSSLPAAPLPPRVTIVLATYNGAAHLTEQLASYVAQRGVHWDLWVSDDGSCDGTRAIVDAFAKDHAADRDIRVIDGPGQGSAANFMALLTHPDLPTTHPVALSDQDDVWHPDKLAHALGALQDTGPLTLFSGQSYHTDTALTVTGHSIPPSRAPSFRNALVQNVASGHSIVLDPEALAVVRRAGVPKGIPYHDWWLYQLISGAGGHVHIDRARMIHYRQHTDNTMGANDGLRAQAIRIGQLFGTTYKVWLHTNMAALSKVDQLLTQDNRAVLTALRGSPKGPGRYSALRRQGIYRQTKITTAALYLAAVLGRI
jgi:glycosyltransferase involved in cell wall biosynthesis